MIAELTLGAEEELHLIDLESHKLSARAPQLLSRLDPEHYSAEIQRTTVETNTEPVDSLDGLRAELLRLREGLVQVATLDGLGIAAVGTAPTAGYTDMERTSSGRFGRMQEQYRLLVDEQLICGLQIHVGVGDRDLAVEILQRVSRDLPVLLALSASSPYWNEQDTGYASIRSLIWQRWPTAGSTGTLGSAAEYDALLDSLIGSGVIADSKMAYFDVRPSSHAPTLELRVCDGCPIVDDAVLIAGLFRAAVLAAAQDAVSGRPYSPVPPPLHRAAMWQAARSGLSGPLLDPGANTHPEPASVVVRGLVRRLRPQLEELGDWKQVARLTRQTLARGNSADRQRAAFAERGRLGDVVDLVVAETGGPAGGPAPDTPTLRRYRRRAGDEAVGPGPRARPAYGEVLGYFRDLSRAELNQRRDRRKRFIDRQGLSFGVEGRRRRLAVDLVPRIVGRHEWDELAAGLTQRARALELFLRDVYGSADVVRDGVLSSDLLVNTPGWRPEARRLPEGVMRAPVVGFDLVRDEFGGWRVLEDNLRNPSGIAFTVAIRQLMDAAVPDLPRPPGLLRPDDGLAELRRCLSVGPAGEGGGAVGLFTTGPESSAYFEHRMLAERAGLLLVEADDLEVAGEAVRHAATGERIDSLYLRLDQELVDVVRSDGRPIGAEIFEVAARGGVGVVSAPGNGVADDKSMYCYVPELIGYYLDERPVLESVPTYRTRDPAEARIVLDRVGELVTKPVDGHGGAGVVIGPRASVAEVAARRAEIAADPASWVAQEVVRLSSHPTLSGARLHPRHVDLRAFVYLRGVGPGEATLAPLALTRVAPEGSLVVNSSRGGGAKDTWIVAGPETDDPDSERQGD